jgi:hypothetical protein
MRDMQKPHAKKRTREKIHAPEPERKGALITLVFSQRQ